MLRKVAIFFCLLSAYLLQLGHDIIPHHHHHDDHSHVAVEHHHDDHHDSDDQEGDDHADLPELFAHFIHAPYNLAGSTQIDFAKLTPVTLAVLTQHFLLPLPDTVESTAHPPDDDFCLHTAILSTSLPERAPPAC